MGKPVRVTPEAMGASGSTLTGLAQQMAGGLGGLQATVQGDGNPWGADEQGSVFGQLYVAVLGRAFESIASHVEQVGYAGQALTAQAGGYCAVESAAATAFASMRAGLV